MNMQSPCLSPMQKFFPMRIIFSHHIYEKLIHCVIYRTCYITIVTQHPKMIQHVAQLIVCDRGSIPDERSTNTISTDTYMYSYA